MCLSISLLIPMTTLFTSRKSVLLAKFQSPLGPSTAAFVIVVLLASTIIVDGWSEIYETPPLVIGFPMGAYQVLCFAFYLRVSLLQNNCIGEKNTRYFMAFLLWHFLICLYGAVALGFVLAGRVKELRVIHILTAYYGVENSFRGLAPRVVQWLLGAYNTQILLMVFLAIVSLLLAGFFCYHAQLCLTNTTTNETFKWQDYISLQKKINEAKASAAALKASISGLGGERKPSESKWRAFFRRSPLEDVEVVVKNNMYDRGFLRNLWEMVFPFSSRSSFSQTKLKHS